MKLTKNKKITIVGIGIFLITICVSALSYTANNVTYSSSSLSGNNVKDALDNLINKCESSTTTCPSGMACTDKTIKCKRATTLHTEVCYQSNSLYDYYCAGAGYNYGETVTFGNTTTTEGVLTPGDAFDCDVNGDGTFDATTERFYFLSEYFDTQSKQFYDNIAVLVYYSTVEGGVENYKALYPYYMQSGSSSFPNNMGPLTAMQELPTITQWSNITLYKDSRSILTENGTSSTAVGNLPTNFSYAGYAARLLTSQEIYRGCRDYSKSLNLTDEGFLDSRCQFLMENTEFLRGISDYGGYGLWIETPVESTAISVYMIQVSDRKLVSTAVSYSNYAGVHPVIEIPKSQILY